MSKKAPPDKSTVFIKRDTEEEYRVLDIQSSTWLSNRDGKSSWDSLRGPRQVISHHWDEKYKGRFVIVKVKCEIIEVVEG